MAVKVISFTKNDYNWVWNSRFWSQTRWVIPMTSSIQASIEPSKFRKKWESLKRVDISNFGLLVRPIWVHGQMHTCSISPKTYRKVRKLTMDRIFLKMRISRIWTQNFSIVRSMYYSLKYLGAYFLLFLIFESRD